ncbi:Cyclic di-GMP phosphodiesterase response regulator RpfG [Caloramator mitchellensis]|uniref:Cyclic di-GMP phosphodiesterase response regulator RpfG n=1 Tax=Caloramator mitchellensis TaxID=908809 RepID=A0A0R3JYG4_CALMK|nr:HD domain-containing phosphohydrolase [Caloramator mitchellensis]KRQ86270.1 Cyclic di-GMP phosphodiesterase response regulator RpfG [Caloramator mitchellensis]
MSLSKKLLYTVTIVQMITILLFSIIFFKLTINQIKKYEEGEIISEVKQIGNIIARDLDSLAHSTSDWALWKDTYLFINDKNDNYINENINLKTFENLNINYMIFIDSKNKIKYYKGFDILNGNEIKVDNQLIDRINALINKSKQGEKIYISSIVKAQDNFVMLSGIPIAYENAPLEYSGILIFGRTLDENYVESISERTNIPLELKVSFNKTQDERIIGISKNIALSYNQNKEYILGKMFYSNPNVTDTLVLSFKLPRKMFLFYKIISLENIIIFLVLVLISGLFLFFIIKNQITNRIFKLTNDVIKIRNDNDFSERVSIINGPDEVSTLSVEINKMLDKLEKFKNNSIEHESKYRNLLETSNERLKQIIDFLPDATFAIDKEGKVIVWNRAMEEMSKVKSEDILGKGNFEYSIPFRKERKPILIDFVFNKNHKLDDCYLDFKINDDGSVIGESHDVNLGIYTWGKASPLYDKDGNIFAAIETIRDITDKIESEKSIIYQKKFFETLFLRTGDAIAIFNKDNKIVDINENFEKVFGYTKEECIGYDIDEIVTNNNHGIIGQAREITSTVYDNGYFETEGIRFDKSGNPIDMIIKGVTIKIDGEIIGGFAIYSDISSKKKFENKLKYLSLHDSLTGLYNRNYFDSKILELQKSDEFPISIISIDVNGLKLINDTLGHLKGDELLVRASQILRRAIEADLIFRVGGDEFIVVLPNTDENSGEELIEKIIDEFDKYNKENADFPINISLGLSTAKNKNDSLIEIYKRADDFMYKNKLIQKTSPKSQILSTLMSALAERDFLTSGHADRVTNLCLKLGEKVGLSSNELTRLTLLGEVHDLGKVGIPDSILFKNGPLDNDEWEVMKQHCEKGYRIALSSPELASIAELILKHHEKWDGSGYPLGIKGKEIPIECRILNIVDSYDAMISDRPYRKGMKKEDAIKEIIRCSGTQFDPELVPLFIEIITKDE